MNDALAALTRALLGRELNGLFALGVLLLAVTGVVTAGLAEVIVSGASLPSGVSRLIVRADLTMVGVASAIMILRAATRIEEDRRDAWLDPWVCALSARWQYGIAVIVSVVVPALLLAGIGSAAFGISLWWRAGSAELLTAWPDLMLRTTVLFLSLGTCAVLVSLLVRSAAAAVVICAIIFLGPIVAITAMALITGDITPHPALRMLALALPQGALPHGSRGALITLAQAAVLGLLCAPAAMRHTGRRP